MLQEPLSHKGSKNLDDHKLEHYLSALSALAGSTTTGLPGDTERQITFSTMGHEAVDGVTQLLLLLVNIMQPDLATC